MWRLAPGLALSTMRLVSVSTRTWRAALLLSLSMMLLACATDPAPAPVEPTVVVRTVKETPPAELTRCPVLPRGLPTTGSAQIPEDWRAGIGRLAVSHGRILDQLLRLIAFETGAPCPGTTPDTTAP